MDGMVNEFYEPVECSALEPDEKEQMVSRAVFEQVMWERDIALKQLSEIGKGLGEKMDDVATVVHGYWIMHDDEILGLTCECSNCHTETMGDGNYCGKCGAKMDVKPIWLKEVEGRQKMDALEFMMYAKRMCKQYGETKNSDWCEGCPALNEEDVCILNFQYSSCIPDKALEAVEKYAKQYPIKTNQDKFLEAFPETELKRGFIDICPRVVSKEYRSKSNEYGTCSLISLEHDCEQCEKEFWLSEAK